MQKQEEKNVYITFSSIYWLQLKEISYYLIRAPIWIFKLFFILFLRLKTSFVLMLTFWKMSSTVTSSAPRTRCSLVYQAGLSNQFTTSMKKKKRNGSTACLKFSSSVQGFNVPQNLGGGGVEYGTIYSPVQAA